MVNTADLRYVHTEEAVRAAFMDMLKEQPMNTITVSAVCRRAGISRNAFYLHHSSIAALYNAMLQELVDAACASSKVTNRMLATGEGTLEEVCERSLRALEPHLGTLRAFLSVDDGTLMARLFEVTETGLATASADIQGSEPDENRRLMLSHLAYGLVGFLKAWLLRTDWTVDQVLDSFARMNSAALFALKRYTADCMELYGTSNAPASSGSGGE